MEDEIENSPGSEEITETPSTNANVVESAPSEDALHPGWNEMLEALPSSLHSTVTPFLRQRDKSYQDGINKVHSQYEPYKPYIDNGIDRDKIDYALQIMQAVETRPEEMIKALQAYTGMTKAEATEVVKEAEEPGQVENEVPDELFNHPKFREMEQMVQTVAQHLVSQRQQEQENEQDRQLAEELETLRTNKGEFDEGWVLTYAMAHNDLSLEQCVDAYNQMITAGIEQKHRAPAPKVMGKGGGNVDSQMTQEDLKDPKARKAVIAQMLAAGRQT